MSLVDPMKDKHRHRLTSVSGPSHAVSPSSQGVSLSSHLVSGTFYAHFTAVSPSSHPVSNIPSRALRRDDFLISQFSLLISHLILTELRPVFSGNTSRDFGRHTCRLCGIDWQKAVYFIGGECRLVELSALSILPGCETLSFFG